MYAQNFIDSHTQALSRHSNKTAIDKQVCFYRRLFANPVKSQRTKTDPVRPLMGINRVDWGPFCSFVCLLNSWYGQGCCGHLSGLLGTQLGQLCPLAVLTHPHTPSTPLYAALLTLQAVFRMSLKTSQSNQ